MPAKQPPNDPPEQLRVLVEMYIEMQPEDTVAQWEAALKDDFLPQLPGLVYVLAATRLRCCIECGAWFPAGGAAGRKHKSYHSDACRRKASRRRQTLEERTQWK